MSVVYLRVICLFVFIWKASAKTNKGEKNYLAASETKLVENILLCLSKIITLICCKALLLFEQREKIQQGGSSDVMMCFLPSLKKFAQYLPLTCISLDLSEIYYPNP